MNNGSLDFERAMEKRRTSALITSLDKLSKHQKMHAGDWITFNIFSESYAPLQNEGHILTAASIWILDRLSELPDGRSRCSVRTSGDISANDICAVHGGGGHYHAAVCELNEPPIDARDIMEKTCVKFLKESGDSNE